MIFNILGQVAGRMHRQLGRSAQMRMRGMAVQSRLPELSVGSWSRVCIIALSSNFLPPTPPSFLYVHCSPPVFTGVIKCTGGWSEHCSQPNHKMISRGLEVYCCMGQAL